MKLYLWLGVLGWALLLPPMVPAAVSDSPGYRVETVTEGLVFPWSLAFLPDGRKLVTERGGQLRVIQANGELVPIAVAGLPEIFVSGQAGLKEVALAPDFPDSEMIYLSYACGTERANNTCLARGRFAENQLHEVETIFTARPAKSGNAHYGGRIAFLPDNTLVLTLGDGFDYREQAQNPSNHLGTLVRLHLDGVPPADNPLVGQLDAAPEVYTLGHRNVQGIVFDDQRGRLLIHEHGPRGGDELNLVRPGKNYGWPIVSHGIDYTRAKITPFTQLPGYEDPLLHWTPAIAPAGMTLYRGTRFPQWQGDLLIAALAGRAVHRVSLTEDGAEEKEILFAELRERIRDVRTGPDGAVYLLTDSERGRLLRVVPEP